MELKITNPKAHGHMKPIFESDVSNRIIGEEFIFTSWEDENTRYMRRRSAELMGWSPTPATSTGLPVVPEAKNAEDEALADWYLRKAEEHSAYMESRLGTPRTEEEGLRAARNHGALADGRALEL